MAGCNYRVFLSFRGPDTRHNLVRYIYEKLTLLGIAVFLDEEEIQYGDRIGTTIEDAIERSEICIPVFSQDFASSAACLMEVAQMVESGKEIHPIFFFVEPYIVRHQLGTYGESLAEHKRKNRYPESIIKKWEDALKEIAGKKGLEFKKAALEAGLKNALEAALKDALEAYLGENGVIKGPELKKAALEAAVGGIKGPFYDDLFSGFRELEGFISELWTLSAKNERGVAKNLVGIDRDIPDMIRKLGFDYQDGQPVRERTMTGTARWVLVVWGLPGVGKTTLANEVFRKIRHHFEGYSFLGNVRGMEQVSLQKKLIRELKRGVCPEVNSSTEGTAMIKHLFQQKRVLIVLDDVDDFKQIEPLAKKVTWFGPGSTIILTTTRNDVYKVRKSEEQVFDPKHKVELMKDDDALELFRNCAFGPNHPLKHHEEMSKQIICAVGKLPFAIESVGRLLYGESEKKWKQILAELNVKPETEVKKILLANYELLSYEAKEVFLDIACFFTGVEKTIPCYMWTARRQGRGVEELKNKSFINIKEKKEFWMLGQLILLGREIVEEENRDNLRKRRRLWDYKDFQKILREKKDENYKVEALRIASNFKQVDGEVFCHLRNLRFLELDKVDIKGNPKKVLPNLIWLDWRGCKEKSKLFAFDMEDLVILNLCSSSAQLSLKDWEKLMEKAQSLEVLNLKDCTWTNASLKFPASGHLKCLTLEGCLYLKSNETISKFQNLVTLNIKHCKCIKDLPQALCSMKALKELLIDGTDIAKLQFKGSLPALEILSACGCEALCEVTDSIGLLKSLRKLALSSCSLLTTLPHVFGELCQMQKIDLSYTSIGELPPCVKNCNKLQVLKMARTFLQRFPEAIEHLEELKELDFTNCGILSGRCNIAGLISLKILRLKGTNNAEVFPRDKAQLCLHILELDHD